jgi:hypothetical protein
MLKQVAEGVLIHQSELLQNNTTRALQPSLVAQASLTR